MKFSEIENCPVDPSWNLAPPTPTLNDHPFLERIRAIIADYRKLSPLHFAVHVAVQADETFQPSSLKIENEIKVHVFFHNYYKELEHICRPVFHEGKFTGQVEVKTKCRKWITLDKKLAVDFPPDENQADEATLRAWWDVNGKSFNWSGLPTELKEIVLQFCVSKPHGLSDFYTGSQAYKRRNRQKSGIYEVVGQLGAWKSLLQVSHQVRAIVLSLLLVRNELYSGGLSIISLGTRDFKDVILRLGQYLQLNGPNSLPPDPH